MKINKLKLNSPLYPVKLREIPNPPKNLYYLSNNIESLFSTPTVAIVGSRKVTSYGKFVTSSLAVELAGKGIVIISGLALGVDALAHKGALDSGGLTIAVLPCGLDRIYPATNYQLAKKILANGGAIITEYSEGSDAGRENFIARNRIISGLSDGVLITEAAEKSGTLHTANFALEQGREVLAVPGNINSQFSKGTNNLIKVGATPVTNAKDILTALNYKSITDSNRRIVADNKEEQIIINLILDGISDTDEIMIASKLTPEVFNQSLTMLEINGKIKSYGNEWSIP